MPYAEGCSPRAPSWRWRLEWGAGLLRIRPRSSTTLAVVVAVAGALVASCGSDNATVSLFEVERVHLPEGFAPEKVAVGEFGTVALLSPSTRQVAVVRGGTVQVYLLPVDLTPSGIRFSSASGSELELLTSDGSRYTLDPDGDAPEVMAKGASGSPVEVLDATPAPSGGWFVYGTWEDAVELYWYRDEGWRYLAAWPRDGRGPADPHVTSHRGEAILASSRPPFGFISVDTLGQVRSFPDGVGVGVVGGGAQGGGHDFAFPPVVLDDWVFQVRVDRRADLFDVVTLDRARSQWRTRAVAAPIILVGANADGTQVVALQNLTGLSELVTYALMAADR